MTSATPAKVAVNTPELAVALGVSAGAVRRWARDGLITPNLTLPGGQHRWIEADVLAELRRAEVSFPAARVRS